MIIKKKTVFGSIVLLDFLFFCLLIGGIFLFSREKTVPVRDFPEIQNSGVLNVVTEYNSVGYYVSGDTISGLQYQLCQYIEKRSGLQVHITLENNLETSIRKLNEGVYDVIAINIPVTNESKKQLAFTVPVTQNKQVLVQRKPAPGQDSLLIRNQMDLANKMIYVPENSPCLLRLKNLSEEIAGPIYIHEVSDYTQEQILYMVAYGEVDYAVVDKEIALNNSKLFPEIDIQTDISFTQLQAWATRKSAPVLTDSLNKWIMEYKKR